MQTRPWIQDLELRGPRTAGPAVGGYAQHVARTERAVGLILWIALGVVLVVTSL
ncbi:MAG: hypothetical protein IT454_17850 [Planctomycetes bacterium]|nr:hypothetical protein [Planctomycetota bacterium]